MKIKVNSQLRDVENIKVRSDGNIRIAYIAKAKVNGILRTIWEMVVGYIFTTDHSAIKTNQGSIIKCNNQ